jgi:seryl-tRNA(Sec) selenium transferase
VALPVSHMPAETLAARLRTFSTPVVGRIADGRVLLDMLTVADCEVETVAVAVLACLAP